MEAAGNEVENNDDKKTRKPRRRMKAIHAKIRDQMEFYFGDANLHKDRFMKKIIEENTERYVDLNIFLKFNKIANLTSDVNVIADALMYKSSMLEVNEDKTKVRRTTPVCEPKNVDERTVYVECLPHNINHDWVKKLFSSCGKVAYVSLPRYPSSRDLKGFAFVEFETIDGAQAACKELNNPPVDQSHNKIGMFPKTSHQLDALKKKLPEDEIEDTEASVKVIAPHEDKEDRIGSEKKEDNPSSETSATKRQRTDSENETDGPNPSKRKKADTLDESVAATDKDPNVAKRKKVDTLTGSEVVTDADQNDAKHKKADTLGENNESTDPEQIAAKHKKADMHGENNDSLSTEKTTPGSKKKSRKRKSRSKTCESNPQDSDVVKSDGELDKSVETVPEKKVKLDESVKEKGDAGKTSQTESNDKENNVAKDKKRVRRKKPKKEKEVPELRVIPKKEWLKLREEYLDLQKSNMKLLKQTLHKKSDEANKEKEDKKKRKEIQFIPDVIVKVVSEEAITRKKLKESFKEDVKVAYVDITDGLSEGFVRCQDAESATKLLNTSLDGVTFSQISGDEEKQYWEKLTSDRDTKLNTKCRSKKRGHQKLMDKAQKAVLETTEKRQHIVFEDD